MRITSNPLELSKQVFEGTFLRIRSYKRQLSGETNTWWDNRNYVFLKDQFLRDGIDLEEGVEHPSRVYLRKWLSKHPGLELLDIPSGVGVEYEGFLKYKTPVKYLGMDLTDTIIKAFKDRFPKGRIKQGDIQNIPLKDSSIDVVLARHILEHLPDHRLAIMECLRVSKKYVIIILFRTPSKKVKKEIGWGAWDNRLDLDELKSYFKLLNADVKVTTISSAKNSKLEPNVFILLTKK